MTKLILIRHGETSINVASLLHSRNDPEKLTPKGIKQIEKTAKVLKDMHLSALFVSNEKRALESAEIISKACGIPLKQISGLEERNWGKFSGKTWKEIQKVLDPMSIEERYTYIPPNGESWKEFEARLISAIESIAKKNGGGVIAVVTQGGSIRALMPYLLGVPKEISFKYDPGNASLTIFEYKKGKYTNIILNDTNHLK